MNMSSYKIIKLSKVPEREPTYPYAEMEPDTAVFIDENSHSVEAIRMSATRAGQEPGAIMRKVRFKVARAVYQGKKGAWVMCVKRTHARRRNSRDTTVDPTTPNHE
jgi:hypothetical protein